MADDMKPVSALDVTKLVPPSPTSVRARLVLLDGARHRLAKADPEIQEALKRLPQKDPHPADVVLIQRAASKLVPDPCLFKDPANVLLGFRAIGVEGPYCQFLRHEEPSDLRADLDERKRLGERLERGELTQAEYSRALHERTSRRWSLAGDDAVEWDRIVYARTGVSIGPPGAFTGNPPRAGSGCGRVEQWIALANVMTACLLAFRNPAMPYRGFLLSDRALTADDLVIGISDGPPVLAAGSRVDFSGNPADNEVNEIQRSIGMDPAKPSLSMAGLAVLVWAVAHQRLRVMYDSVTNMDHRFRLGPIAEYLGRSKPILEWDDSDSALLDEVGVNLSAAAPHWMGERGAGVPLPSARDHAADAAHPNTFRRVGNGWEVSFQSTLGWHPHVKGFEIVAKLLANPDPQKPMSVMDLEDLDRTKLQATTPQPVAESEEFGDIRADRERICRELDRATRNDDRAAIERLTKERDELDAHVKSLKGFDGRTRPIGPDGPEKASYKRVQAALRHCYEVLEGGKPSHEILVKHLRAQIKVENYAYAYRPGRDTPAWMLG